MWGVAPHPGPSRATYTPTLNGPTCAIVCIHSSRNCRCCYCMAYLARPPDKSTAGAVSCRSTLVNQACCDGTPPFAAYARCLADRCLVPAASYPLHMSAAPCALSHACCASRHHARCFPPNRWTSAARLTQRAAMAHRHRGRHSLRWLTSRPEHAPAGREGAPGPGTTNPVDSMGVGGGGAPCM